MVFDDDDDDEDDDDFDDGGGGGDDDDDDVHSLLFSCVCWMSINSYWFNC